MERPELGLARLLFVPAGLLLLAFAGLVCYAATALSHIEAPHVYASAACLGLMAVGLAWARPWAYAFALPFFAIVALGIGTLTTAIGYAALTGTESDGWAQVRLLVYGSVAVGAGLVGALATALVVGLWLVRKHVSGPRGVAERLAFAALGALALAWLGWSLGHEFVYRELPVRNECLARGAACPRLARARSRFTTSERRGFARAGCLLGNDNSCSALAALLTAADPASGEEAQALASRCVAGSAPDCYRLGDHLLKIGDRPRGSTWLTKACAADAGTCHRAAESCVEHGAGPLADELLARGCAREEPRSCTLLLRRVGPSLSDVARHDLHLKVCLLTDVNECLPLIRSDWREACPVICEGTTANRMQSCDRCAKQAESSGAPELALAWSKGNCQRGHRPSCAALDSGHGRPTRDRPPPARGRGAARPRASRCARSRGDRGGPRRPRAAAGAPRKGPAPRLPRDGRRLRAAAGPLQRRRAVRGHCRREPGRGARAVARRPQGARGRMRLERVAHGHTLSQKILLRFIALVERRELPDVVKTLFYRKAFFGDRQSRLTQQVMRGPSEWTVGQRELFAAFVSRLNQCPF